MKLEEGFSSNQSLEVTPFADAHVAPQLKRYADLGAEYRSLAKGMF